VLGVGCTGAPGRSFAARLQRSEHNVRPSKSLRNLRCDIAEAFRINDRRRGRPGDLTTAGMLSGSTSSIFSWSWLIWAEAKGVMGEDWDTVPPGASRPWGAVMTRTRAG
jgi:hypothetical protein